ncbi:MAG TPA: hypothetical protein VHD38_02790 [Candidatus Paceibacterota bacterium]|jgi:hypothetical protein|nr:hypothetical protein [Candidatus Paceibacterota bacterium]
MQLDRTLIAAVEPTARFLKALSHDDFVLHGSLRNFTIARPHLARGSIDWEHQNRCAVYASIAVEFALIHALIQEPSYRFDHELDKLMVHDEHIVVRSGFIHVLPGDRFEPVDDGAGGLWRLAYEPVEVLATIEVIPELLAHFPFIAFKSHTLTKEARS